MTAQFRTTYQTNEYTQMAPEKVVLALLDAALTATTKAMIALEDGDIGTRGEAVSRALAIVGELQSVLDVDTGELAQNLFSLYDYAQRELLTGNMSGNVRHFQNADTVLTEIREGWAQMLQTRGAAAAEGVAQSVREYA